MLWTKAAQEQCNQLQKLLGQQCSNLQFLVADFFHNQNTATHIYGPSLCYKRAKVRGYSLRVFESLFSFVRLNSRFFPVSQIFSSKTHPSFLLFFVLEVRISLFSLRKKNILSQKRRHKDRRVIERESMGRKE